MSNKTLGNRRALAFDFGTKTIGVATGQTTTMTSQALTSINAKDGIPQWTEIANIIQTWQPNILIVGLPLHMDGSENLLCKRARKFANRLHAKFGIPVELVDERLSSEAAKNLDAKGDIHGRSAMLILDTWFNRL